MRRRLAVVLVLIVALTFGACGGGGSSITVVIADYSKDHTKPFWQGLAEQYTKQTGVKVDLRVIDWNSIDQHVSTMIQANQPPDVLNLNSFSRIIPLYVIYSHLGLLDSRLGLIATHISLTLPLSVWLLRGFVLRVLLTIRCSGGPRREVVEISAPA